jgi:hypothetical protein
MKSRGRRTQARALSRRLRKVRLALAEQRRRDERHAQKERDRGR